MVLDLVRGSVLLLVHTTCTYFSIMKVRLN